MYKYWLMVSRSMDDKLANVIEFVVNDIQTLINIVHISGVQISLLIYEYAKIKGKSEMYH